MTGHFRSIIIFTIIILVHELGHFLTALFLGWDVDRIDIYPYGGCSKFDVDINVPLWQEFLVLIMGPVFQLIFVYFSQYFVDYSNLLLFEKYSKWILLFNLLPIFPLDGGKFVQIILGKFISYYRSCQITLYLSYFFMFFCLFFLCLLNFNFILVLIFIILFINLLKEINKSNYYYHRFLLERYLNNYFFRRKKKIDSIRKMKRDTYHIISNISERDYLKSYFKI